MNYELCQGVLPRAMRVTQADLLVVVLVKADVRAIKVLDKVFESDPEDAILFFVDFQLITHVLAQFSRCILPVKLPFTLRSSAIRIPNLDNSETLIIGPDLGQSREHCVGMVICESLLFDSLCLLPQLKRVDRGNHWLIHSCRLLNELPE